MLSKEVCQKCRCYQKPFHTYGDHNVIHWDCIVPYKPGDMGMTGYTVSPSADPPEHCDHKLEHAVAAGIANVGS